MTASGAPVTLDPNGKGKVKSKSKGSAESAGAGSKSRSKNGKGRRKKRRRSSSPEDVDDEEGESEAESAEIASSDEEDDADEASAVSNLLSLRANASGLKGAPTLVAPLHHNLTSYTPSLGSMASTATVVGSVSGWGYPSSSSSSTFTPNGNTITGSKPYFSPFQTSFNPHKSYSSMFTPNGVNNPMPQFSLSKAYSSGTTPYEASISASADHADGIPDAADLHNGYHHNGIGHVQNTVSNVRSVNEMSDSEQLGAFQSDMAMSSLRSTSSALRSTNGLEGLNGSNGLDLDKGAVGRTHSLTPPSRLGSEGRENRDRVMNLDPTLAAMDMQSKHAVINKASESPTNDIDAINASSESNSNSPLVCDSTSTPTPVHKPTSVTSIGSQNAEQGAANFVDSDFQSNRQTYMSPMESNGTEPRTTLRPVESEKDWRM
ncbi:hypothetical protein F5050DRAFT_273016 [Lentinula boryana]|uniref:Uncharacterized protein n=1 Tax=Lentinula boryana TaxID=40481 RepID=A0ABQ8QAL3_9AGAR|nr:hypothetical protein F5050DRAFT_273016 [Lentinula boryana]